MNARKQGRETQDDSVTKFVVAAVMLFGILLVGGGVTVAIQLAGRTNVEQLSGTPAPATEDLAGLEARATAKVAETLEGKRIRLLEPLSSTSRHRVNVGLTKDTLQEVKPMPMIGTTFLTLSDYKVTRDSDGVFLDFSGENPDPPDSVFLSIDEREPIQIWCTQEAFQDHVAAQKTAQTTEDIENLTLAKQSEIGISEADRKLVDKKKPIVTFARADSQVSLALVAEGTDVVLSLFPSEGDANKFGIVRGTNNGSPLIALGFEDRAEGKTTLTIQDGEQAKHEPQQNLLAAKNALREARLAITYNAPPPTSGAQPISETVEVWFSDDGRQAVMKRAKAEEQRLAADKARKELETKQTQARQKDESAFSRLIKEVEENTPVGIPEGELPQKITLASGIPELQALSLAISCASDSGLSWTPAENAGGTWKLSAEARPIATAAVDAESIVITFEPNLSPQDQARVAFAVMTLSLNPNPDTWGDGAVSVNPASFRIASPLQLNWDGIVQPSELIDKGAATVCTAVPPIARGLLDLSDTHPELYPLTVTLGDAPKAPEHPHAFSIVPADDVASRNNADLGTIVFAPEYPEVKATIRFFDLEKDRKDAAANAKTVDRDKKEMWAWVDRFLTEKDVPRPPPLRLQWRLIRQIRENEMCLSLEGRPRLVALGNPEEPSLYKGKFNSQKGELPDELANYILNVLSARQRERSLSKKDATDVADNWINKNYDWLSPENKRINVNDYENYLKVVAFDDWLQGPIFLAALKACNQTELREKMDYTPEPQPNKKENEDLFSPKYLKRVEDWKTRTILKDVVAGFHENLKKRCATLTASSDGEMTDDDKLVYFYAVANSLDYYFKAWDATKEELDRAPLTFTVRVGVPGADPENAETTGLIIDGVEKH